MNYLILKWYTVDDPWGDGTVVVAGDPDPHLGKVICSNEHAVFNPESYDVEDVGEFIRNTMKHIVEIHNCWIEETGRGAINNSQALVD